MRSWLGCSLGFTVLVLLLNLGTCKRDVPTEVAVGVSKLKMLDICPNRGAFRSLAVA